MGNKSWSTEPRETPRGKNLRRQERAGPREYDRDSCPAGWDRDLWNLTLQFEQDAAREGIQLATGRPVIYALLKDRCHSFRDSGYARHKRWSVDGVNTRATWQEIVSAAITRHFRDYQEDEYAAYYFCGPLVFGSMIREVREHGSNLYALRQSEARYGPVDYDQSYAREGER